MRASGLAEIRCSASLVNSECKRRTSRYCVVRKRGKFVYKALVVAHRCAMEEPDLRERQTSRSGPSCRFAQDLLSWPATCIAAAPAFDFALEHRVPAAEKTTLRHCPQAGRRQRL